METFLTTFERTLNADDSKQNIPFAVTVPEGTTHLHIRFTYSPPLVDGIHNLLTLSLFDPSGWRGAGHRHGELHEVVVGADGASPGYLAGPVQAGLWTVVVDVHWIMSGPPCVMRLQVSGTDEPVQEMAALPPPGHTASRGPGWYRGDLHAHTIHSDASWDVAGLVAYARANHLDFATLSDHNTISGLAEMDAAARDDLLVLGGMELTTFWGHALALGLRGWIDWRVRPGERSMDQIEQEVSARGGLFIIAHPKETGDPFCTGCDWRYPTMMPGGARVVEVWNGDWASDSNNEDGLSLVFGWLNQGCHLALTAGTDNHGRRPGEAHYGYNVVYAEDLTEADILNAIRAGHLYISAGPRLELTAVSGKQQAMMGDELRPQPGAPLYVTAGWSGCSADAHLDWIVDGEIRDTFFAGSSGAKTWELSGGQAHWCLFALRSADGLMLAFTNPIYLDGGD